MNDNKNIFCASNPARLCEALWAALGAARPDDIIFLPSRRAVRSVEKMLVKKTGRATLLPRLVALGEADEEIAEYIERNSEVVSNLERIIVLANLIRASGQSMRAALGMSHELIRMFDYLENEIGNGNIDWLALVNEKYSAHWQEKAKFLVLISRVLPEIFTGRITEAQKRNLDIRSWINGFGKYGRVFVCGSTGSVPATADLMAHIAGLPNGIVILPGKAASGQRSLVGETNPYCSELKFLERVGRKSVEVIDVGESNIDWLNRAFCLSPIDSIDSLHQGAGDCARIDCARESEEAAVVAEICGSNPDKSVLVITPDAAGNQRLREAFFRRGIEADFSSGIKATQTRDARVALQVGESEIKEIDDVLAQVNKIVERHELKLAEEDLQAIRKDVLSQVQLRPEINDNVRVKVLGTVESRMQTADIVILTGLNEGMFPSLGFSHPWIPRAVADVLGLPMPERKVSLMSLDFISLSCAPRVYWLRSKISGGQQTTESRFLSRIEVMNHGLAVRDQGVLERVRSYDNIPYAPLDDTSPAPPADLAPISVTRLEDLIHNPYVYYVKKILGLTRKPDEWEDRSPLEFGNIVHKVIEDGIRQKAESIIEKLYAAAKMVLPEDSVLLSFWCRRFVEIEKTFLELQKEISGKEIKIEERGEVVIAGRIVHARADLISCQIVYDIKTGAVPTKAQFKEGMAPQLPLEKYMLENGAYGPFSGCCAEMRFVRLQRGREGIVDFSPEENEEYMRAAIAKASEIFNIFGHDRAKYEYRPTTEKKYREFDDLARVD